MASAQDCYYALCNIRSAILRQLNLLGYDVEGNDCYHMCLTDLVSIYSTYTGRTYSVDNLDYFIEHTAPSEEWANKAVSCNGEYAICVEVSAGEYEWSKLDEAAKLIEHTINYDGVYNASDFAADGFSKIVVNTSAQRNLQNKTVTPTDELQAIQADEGFSGLGTVVVRAVPVENKRIVPTSSAQVILPSEGYLIKQVNVDAVINQEKQVTPGVASQQITADAGYNGLSKVTVSGDNNLLPENIKSGISIFNVVGTASEGAAFGKPIEVSTVADMDTRRSNASALTYGTIYKYTGATSGDYVSNALYIVDKVDNTTYVLKNLGAELLQLNDTTLAIANNALSWTAVPYASRYAIYSNNTIIAYATTTSYTLVPDSPGIFSIYVKAIADGYSDSENSNTVIWRVGNAYIDKHGIVSFPVNTLETVATEFDNRAIFIGNLTSNSSASTMLAYNEDLTYESYSQGNKANAVAATTQRLMYTDNELVYAYDSSMTVQSGSLSAVRTYSPPAACNVGNYVIFAGGIQDYDGMEYPSNTAEAFDSNMVRTVISGLNEYVQDMVATEHRGYAIFAGGRILLEPGETDTADYNIYSTAYDSNLVKVTIDWLQTGCADMAATTVGNYALFAGGTYAVGETYFSDFVATYDENLTTIFPITSHLSEARARLAAASLAGFAVFGGGQNSESTSNVVDVFDAALTRTLPDGLAVAKSNTSAASVGNYIIFAGDATSMYSDVYKIESSE